MPQRLNTLEGEYSICRLEPNRPPPEWALQSGFWALARSEDELSVVCRSEQVPQATEAEPGWRCLQVQGPLDFSEIGVLESLVGPLARARIPVFAISTFDTDYLLVRKDLLENALQALRQAGHQIAN